MIKYILFFDFMKHKEKYDVKTQIFVVSQLYITALGLITLFTQFFITHNQEIIGNSFWIGLSSVSFIFSEICLHLNNNYKAQKLYTNLILAFLAIIVIPLGVYLSGSITSPSIIYVFVGISLISFLASDKLRIFLNSFIVIFCLSFIYMEFKYPNAINIEVPTYRENLEDWAIVFIIILLFFNKLISAIRKLLKKKSETIIQQKNELYIMSITDYLTNLYNKKYLYEILEGFVDKLNNFNESFILIALDIDHFKIYNDTYGHIEGDVCLKNVASIFLESVTKDMGYVFRFGGEEFVIALNASSFDYGVSIINTINDKLNEKCIENINSPTSSRVTLSMGIVLFEKEDNQNYDVNYLLHNLDSALYKAKENGRNQSWANKNNEYFRIEN